MNELPLALYKNVMDHAPCGMALVDPDGVVLIVNARLVEAISSNGASQPRLVHQMLPPVDECDWSSLPHDEPVEWDTSLNTPTCICGVHVFIAPVNEDGARLVTVTGLSERNSVENGSAIPEGCEKLARIQDYYRSILDNEPDGVIVTDCEGTVGFWNKQASEMFGISDTAIVGRCLFEALPCWQAHSAAFQRVMDANEPVQLERQPREDGRGRHVVERITFSPLRRNGELAGVLARVADVTAQADLEKQLVKSERMAAVGELAAGVAHNFNNILAGIGGDAQLLRMIAEEDHLGEAVINSADMIYRETMRGGRIAHDLLSFARGQEPCLSEVDVSAVVSEAIRLAKTYPQTASVELRPQIPPGLPRVSADPNQLHQVFFNIILNAIQAMPHGGTLTVDARITPGDDGRSRLQVSFEDTGVGIPDEMLTRIFDPFFTNRRSGSMGTGLGLSVSQSMVRGMDGEICVESEVGRGTVMTVVLPIVERRRRPRVGEAPKTRILIADDEPTIRRTVSTFLSRSGYHVVSARDGMEAVGILEDAEADFRLAVLDLLMPRLGSLDLVRRVHEMRPNLPIIVLTGVAGTEDLAQAGELGVRVVLAKPVDFDLLLRTVKEYAGTTDIPVMEQASAAETTRV